MSEHALGGPTILNLLGLDVLLGVLLFGEGNLDDELTTVSLDTGQLLDNVLLLSLVNQLDETKALGAASATATDNVGIGDLELGKELLQTVILHGKGQVGDKDGGLGRGSDGAGGRGGRGGSSGTTLSGGIAVGALAAGTTGVALATSTLLGLIVGNSGLLGSCTLLTLVLIGQRNDIVKQISNENQTGV